MLANFTHAASKYPACGSAETSGLCVGSTLDGNGNLWWSGLRKGGSKFHGFEILKSGDVYIGPDVGVPESPGRLLKKYLRRVIDVKVDSKGDILGANSSEGESISNLAPCRQSSYQAAPYSSSPCYGTIKKERAYYVGEFANGKFDGFGYYFFDEGFYFGEFSNDKFEGQGTYQSFLGYKYSGAFEADAVSGRGRLSYVDGGQFFGGFQKDRRHGKGEIIRANGKAEVGVWVNGGLKRVKKFLSEAEMRNYQREEVKSVVSIQKILKIHGFLKGKADGVVGSQTKAAFKAFAKDFRLSKGKKPQLELLDLDANSVLRDLSQDLLKEIGSCKAQGSVWSACFSVAR